MANKTIERAAELLRANPELKYYEAMERARREQSEVDRGAIPGLFDKENRNPEKQSKEKK